MIKDGFVNKEILFYEPKVAVGDYRKRIFLAEPGPSLQIKLNPA